eukprot:GHUV01018204.1.p1 GENE.GHUV01018204.1~~GHUV01018204.1.p1  ORF type:complete len:568 (+),score=175.64 GHUV01018204.1:651-2354(+)
MGPSHCFVGCSMLLLPQQPAADSTATTISSSHTQSGVALAKGGTKSASGAGCSRGSGCNKGSPAAKQPSNPAEVEPSQLYRGGHGLDWSNCCVYNLYPDRGAVVQPPPFWPVTCTASCYAAVSARCVVAAGDYTVNGPHFLDWKCLAERGCRSMAAVPMFSCSRPVAVLCLASDQANAFADTSSLELLGGVLAPYCSKLEYTTRRADMQRLVNEIITPIAAQLAQQKHSRLAQLGCTVEEAPPGMVPAGGKGISVAVGARNPNSRSKQAAQDSRQTMVAGSQLGAAAGPLQRKGVGSKSAASQGDGDHSGSGFRLGLRCSAHRSSPASGSASSGSGGATTSITHKRFESVIVKSQPNAANSLNSAPDLDLDWSDFFFNLVSMAIVYMYFNKAAVAEESLIAVLLCLGVAAFDIVLLGLRWLWFEQYLNYGNLILNIFNAYRAVVLPIANTWMSWSVLNKMSVAPSWPIVALLGVLLVACIIMGLQVRFFLHAPLQLASVLFAATTTPDICGALLDNTSSVRCIGIVSGLQLTLGLVLPSLLVYCLESKPNHAFLPHMQAKRWQFTRE